MNSAFTMESGGGGMNPGGDLGMGPSDFIAPGIGAVGNVVGDLINQQTQADANKANAEQAQANRDFQERMSNSAHQREVRDLELAGLNPLLSANSGASTPSGAMATMNPIRNNVGQELGKMMSSAMQFAQFRKDMEQRDASIVATQAQAEASRASAENSRANAQATESQLPAISAKAEVDRQTSEQDKKFVTVDSYANRLSGWIGSIMDVIGGISSAAARKRAGDQRDTENLIRAGSRGVPSK